jgi:hypothetical protein
MTAITQNRRFGSDRFAFPTPTGIEAILPVKQRAKTP